MKIQEQLDRGVCVCVFELDKVESLGKQEAQLRICLDQIVL